MHEIIAAYGILRIKAIGMYIALMYFDAFPVLMFRRFNELAEVNAITTTVRLDNDPPNLGFPVFQPLGFWHDNPT